MKLIIKNMVCRHCVECVSKIFADLNLNVDSVDLGYVVVRDSLNETQLQQINNRLNDNGFELIQTREAEIVDAIKRQLIKISRRDGCEQREPLSDILSDNIALSYPSMSRIFSTVEGRTIENYYMTLRIERVKELIKYQQLSLSEIADIMGFSSVAHLSRQFKQLTGMTPTQFRRIGFRKRLPEI